MSRIRPEWNDIENPKSDISDELKTFARYLDENLPSKWEIYVKPFLNGDRPDLVILNPRVGLMIWNVIDHSIQQQESIQPIIEHPVQYLGHCRSNIVKLYVPKYDEIISLKKSVLGTIKLGLYLPNSAKVDAVDYQDKESKPKVKVIRGAQFLKKDNLKKIIPDAYKHSVSQYSNSDQELFGALRNWLHPPFHYKELHNPIKLTKRQLEHAQPKPGHFRVKGVAGSGKTTVIAYRAAALAAQNKKVFVVTYNKTLWHYIRYQVNRAPFDFYWNNIVFKHFHGFCSDEYHRLNIKWPVGKNETEEMAEVRFATEIPNHIIQAIQNNGERYANNPRLKYDAILIDEGQDYCWEWYNLLHSYYMSKRDELLLVSDSRQNIYRRKPIKFRGPWRKLPENTYRLTNKLIEELNRYAALYFDNDEEDMMILKSQEELFHPKLIWQNINKDDSWFTHAVNTYRYFFENGVHPSDMIILVTDHTMGWNLAKHFNSKGIQINHVFKDPKTGKCLKELFWMEDSRLKMCTIHSFKGWEIKTVILLIPDENHPMGKDKRLDHMIYTALSRGMENVCVLNKNERYKSFGKEWERLPEIKPIS